MNDRPYVVRRAILDTFLFEVQTPQQCFERLRIALTETSDLVNVFDLLRQVSHTPGTHIDSSSMVTGCWPLAPEGDGHVVMPVRSPRLESLEDKDGNPGSLDWTRALMLLESGTRKIVPAHVALPTKPDGRRAHIIALAGCEGDAVLIAGWAGDHLAELESEIELSAVAISWLSDDFVPVGHMPWGNLEPVVVLADVWVILAQTVLLEHGHLAKRLLAAAAAAGLGRIVVDVDAPERNVRRLAPAAKNQPEESIDRVSIERLDLRPIPGGIFSAALERAEVLLFQHPQKAPPLVDNEPAPQKLQVILVNSALKNDREMMVHLCQTFPCTIDKLFKSWMKISEELRQQPDRIRAYVNAMMQIAQLMKELGFEGPLRTLHSPDDNPMSRWHGMITSAQIASTHGNREASNRELEAILAEMKGASGNAIDELRPKVLGMISANHFYDGRMDQAQEVTRAALEACRQVGDEQGVSVYQQNLHLLETAVTEDDASVAQLARAQELSDQGRYEASNAILQHLVLDEATVLTCKVHGLLGANYFWLGDSAAAARCTREAVRFAERIGDPDALRVYGYNLTRINNPECVT
jgi:tetratricopeptide (TPR) repeat protein